MTQYDDTIGRQLPWSDDQCPARGPALGHFSTRRFTGVCLHCGQVVVARTNLEEVFTRSPASPAEWYAARLNLVKRAIGRMYDSNRPVLASELRKVLTQLTNAALAEELETLRFDESP